MDRRDAVLAMLAAAGGNGFSPAQLQKALFLVSKNAGDVFDNGNGFDFTPYDYGPFDKSVYNAADLLEANELCVIGRSANGYRTYAASQDGVVAGQELLASLPNDKRKYFQDVADWVRSLSFAQLVKSIYEAYPETRANSIFLG